jgi:hypothetical protein
MGGCVCATPKNIFLKTDSTIKTLQIINTDNNKQMSSPFNQPMDSKLVTSPANNHYKKFLNYENEIIISSHSRKINIEPIKIIDAVKKKNYVSFLNDASWFTIVDYLNYKEVKQLGKVNRYFYFI